MGQPSVVPLMFLPKHTAANAARAADVRDERFPLYYFKITSMEKMQVSISLYAIICIYVEWHFYTLSAYANLGCMKNLSVKVCQ